jgi:hypothetical protein
MKDIEAASYMKLRLCTIRTYHLNETIAGIEVLVEKGHHLSLQLTNVLYFLLILFEATYRNPRVYVAENLIRLLSAELAPVLRKNILQSDRAVLGQN